MGRKQKTANIGCWTILFGSLATGLPMGLIHQSWIWGSGLAALAFALLFLGTMVGQNLAYEETPPTSAGEDSEMWNITYVGLGVAAVVVIGICIASLWF